MENTDRELLELAAKAIGIEYFGTGYLIGGGMYLCTKGSQLGMWCPLTDDGDALRLAVKLGMTVLIHRDMALAESGARAFQAREKATPDYSIETATRRAIVRAAAEIGKVMK